MIDWLSGSVAFYLQDRKPGQIYFLAIQAAIDKNKLKSGDRFIEEVERLIGFRIKARPPGRPRT
ncbi:hypothetical protein [Marinobacter sp. LN3S78]|uniref:hypothetical protein n=1 Tax=Marinobacter sp. LN3S78 TaxID=3382300 RepID=UPI00387AAC7A